MVDEKSRVDEKATLCSLCKTMTKLKEKPRNPDLAKIFYIDVGNQLDLQDTPFPSLKKPYASVSVLDTVITVERHGGNYHVSARFNIETTIEDYNSRERSVINWYLMNEC